MARPMPRFVPVPTISTGEFSPTAQVTAPASTNAPSTRYTPAMNFENTLTWLKGRHTVAMGASWANYYGRNWNVTQLVPSVSFGMTTADPAYSIISSSANYPGGLNSTQQGYARNLYSLLTGRVSQVAGSVS